MEREAAAPVPPSAGDCPKVAASTPRRSSRRAAQCAPADDESDQDGDGGGRRPRRPRRLSGCERQVPKRRPDEGNKENIAPVRDVSLSVLAEEARIASERGTPDESIAARRGRRRSVRTAEAPATPRAAPRAKRARLERPEGPADAPADLPADRPADAHPDEAAAGPSSQPATPAWLPSTPRKSAPCAGPTPSSAESAGSIFDSLREPSTPATSPPSTPCKERSVDEELPTGNLYARARALLRGAERHAASAPTIARIAERRAVHRFLDTWLGEEPPADASGCMYISGMPGTGKTALVQSVLAERSQRRCHTVLVNCVSLAHPSEVAAQILHSLTPRVAHDAARDVDGLAEQLPRLLHGRQLVVVLDELDHLLHTHVHQSVLYRLFCLPSRLRSSADARVALVGVANSLDLTERFVPFLGSRGMHPQLLHFQPLGAQDMAHVLAARLAPLGEAPPGAAPLFARPALDLLARKLSAASGDVRRALDACRAALERLEGEQQERHGAEHVAQLALADAPRVMPTHILAVLAQSSGNTPQARVRALGVHAKLVLLAWAVLHARAEAGLCERSGHGGAARISDVEVQYRGMLQRDDALASPLGVSELLDVLERLEVQGLVRITAEAAGGSAPQTFKGAPRASAPATRVSPSAKRAAKRQLLASNRRMAPTLERGALVEALTTPGPAARTAEGGEPAAEPSRAMLDAMRRLWLREEDAIERSATWRTIQPQRERVRREELGGGRSALPPASL